MKKVSLFSSLLAAGMLFGTGMSAMTSHVQVRAATEATTSNQNGHNQKTNSNKRSAVPKSSFKLSVTAENAEFDENTGTLTGFTQEWVDEHPEQIEELLDGGQLEIPDEINGVPVEIIGERTVQAKVKSGEIMLMQGAFCSSTLQLMIGKDPNADDNKDLGISTIVGGTKLTEIGFNGFRGNNLETFNIPNLERIGSGAFANNQLTQIDLPKVTDIVHFAFINNQLTQINLPKVTDIGESAFYSNKLTHIELPEGTDIGGYAFNEQRISHPVMTSNKGEITFDNLQPKLMIDNKNQIPQISDVTVNDSDYPLTIEDGKITNATQETPFGANLTLSFGEEELPSYYSIDSYELTINPFDDNNGGDGDNNGNGGDNNNGNNGSGGGNSGGSTGTETQPDNNTSGSDNNTEVQPLPDPDEEAPAPYSVYALRGMRLHKNVSLTDPVRSYKKQARAKAANFRIEGVAYNQNGKKRYKVKGGYITASSKYVADSHFRSKKINRVRVISNKANSYKDLKLSKNQKVRSYKKGTKLNVKRIVNYGRTTRFELTNGRYISGNKQIFIMDQK